MATFVVAHGAWSTGWAWKKMRTRMAERGHVFITPTHTGLGERAHLLNRDVDLELHIAISPIFSLSLNSRILPM